MAAVAKTVGEIEEVTNTLEQGLEAETERPSDQLKKLSDFFDRLNDKVGNLVKLVPGMGAFFEVYSMAIKAITTQSYPSKGKRGSSTQYTGQRSAPISTSTSAARESASRSKCVSSRRSLEILMSVCCTPSLRLRDGPTTHASTSSVLLPPRRKKTKSLYEHARTTKPSRTRRLDRSALPGCAQLLRITTTTTPPRNWPQYRDMSPAQRLAVAHERHPESHPAADAALLATLQERIDKAKTKAAAADTELKNAERAYEEQWKVAWDASEKYRRLCGIGCCGKKAEPKKWGDQQCNCLNTHFPELRLNCDEFKTPGIPKLLVAAGAAVAVLGTAIVAVYLVSPQNKGASAMAPPPRLAEVAAVTTSACWKRSSLLVCPALAPAEERTGYFPDAGYVWFKQGSTTCIGNLRAIYGLLRPTSPGRFVSPTVDARPARRSRWQVRGRWIDHWDVDAAPRICGLPWGYAADWERSEQLARCPWS